MCVIHTYTKKNIVIENYLYDNKCVSFVRKNKVAAQSHFKN